MKDFWWTVTVDWPCALGDWLWAYLMMPLLAHLEQLTWRLAVRLVLQICLIAVLLHYFELIASMDLTFLFALDVTAYLEIATGLFVLATQGHAGRALGAVARAIPPAIRKCSNVLQRFGTRQRRNINALRRKTGPVRPNDADDAPGGFIGASLAMPV